MNQSLFTFFLENKNVAISGPGGVGKTYQINKLKEYCEKNTINISVCASTGIAAKLIKGTTVHHWAGIKPYMVDKYVEGNLIYYASKKSKENEKRIKKTEVLVIDEVSMLGNHTFDLLDHICRVVRKTDKPFGGIRLIISFDMLQLPPVKENYIFKSNVWNELELSVIYLNKSFRTQDQIFFDLLSRARLGKINEEDKEILKKRVNAVNKNFDEKNIKPTVLYSHKVDVDKLNHDNLKILEGPYYQYKSKDSLVAVEHGLINKDNINNLSSETKKEAKETFEYIDTIVPKEIYLKPNAQVLLTVNKDAERGLVNGSRGIVVSCDQSGVLVKFQEDTTLIGYTDFTHEENCNIYIRSYIPLQLAWALTIHKAQGQSLEYAVLDIGKSIFCPGQAYVALSRMKSLEGTILSNLDTRRFYACEEAIAFDEKLKQVN
jgi:ATP-dependent DNA helicase PIF1